jgi:hypothetical protein
MKEHNLYKSVKNGTLGLAKDAKLHGCTQLEELKNRKLRAERLRQWNLEQNAETIRIIANGQRIPGPDYIITSKPKKEQDKK